MLSLLSGSWIGFGGRREPQGCGPRRETWAWVGRRSLQGVRSERKGLEGCVDVPLGSRGSIITLGIGRRANPRSSEEHSSHAGLDISWESASLRHQKVGSPGAFP